MINRKGNAFEDFALTLVFLLTCNLILAQKTVTVQILNLFNNQVVTDVAVKVKNTNKGTYSNEEGVFVLNKISDNDVLVLSKIGYLSQTIKVNNLKAFLYLEPEVSSLNQVVLRSFSSSQLKRTVPDQIYLTSKDIEKLPFILGEKDVIKLIQYTPGVQQATEGQSGLLVRGGNGSMNLMLLDNIYLHNTSHLGGLFSAVNSDFVQSLEFSKAGFDAGYGGRLSSVIDIQTLQKPDSTNFKGSLGLLSTKLTGNIKINNKNSLLLSGRRTYLEVFKPFFGNDESILGKNKNYFLYDFLAKHDLQLSENNEIQTTFYLTRDNFFDKTKGRNRDLNWGNVMLGTTFSHRFSSTLSSQTTVSNSNYKFDFSDDDFPYSYDVKSSFHVFSLKHHFLLNKNKFVFKVGGDYNLNKVLPKKANASLEDSPFEILNQETYEYSDVSLFGDLEYQVASRLKAKTGLRLTLYSAQKNELVNAFNFLSFEPRLSFKYDFKERQAFKLSYQRLSQFIHQASIGSFSLPADFYLVSTDFLKPQIANQLSLGYVYEENGLQFNSAVYYKNVANYSEFENGSLNNLFSNNLYEDILTGKFDSYGLEVSVNKKVNKLTAQASLTLSRTVAKFDEINNGRYFLATFDRPVNVNAIAHYKLSNKIELGALFLFTSGQNYTRPEDIRIIDARPVINFEPKNASRFSSYHRLDLSCTYAFKPKGRWHSKLNLTFYNVYNHKNLFQSSFSTKGNVDDSYIEIVENKDYLFPFLPTVNWLFSF